MPLAELDDLIGGYDADGNCAFAVIARNRETMRIAKRILPAPEVCQQR